MKNFVKFFCLFLALLLTCLIYTGCSQEEFKHKTVYYNPQYNGGIYKFEITVIYVSNDYSSNIYSRGLDATIEIKTKTTRDVSTGWLLKLYDFEFYLTKQYTIYETYMYLENPLQKITEVVLQPQTTTKLHLRIDYDNSIFSDINELNGYIIKLWDMRI